MSGWPHKCPSADVAPFISKRDAFSLQRDCILFGSRVVIPSQLRQEMLRMLHRSHQGVVATKAIARSYMRWPGMASAIENMISHCSTCQSVRHLPPREPIHPWLDEVVDPWSRLHIDFAGPFRGRYLFVAIDSASKSPEAKVVSNISTSAAIRCLREIFATHGLPRILVSDNGPAFVSAPFRAFLRRCGVKHLYTPSYHLNSNGQAKRTIQTLKQALRKLHIDFDCCLANALFAIRTTPSRVTGRSPAESLMGRRLLSPLDMMLPHAVRAEIARSPFATQLRVFEVGDAVLARNFSAGGPKWLRATVAGRQGKYVYVLRRGNGQLIRRHVDHVIRSNRTEPETDYLWLPSPQPLASPTPTALAAMPRRKSAVKGHRSCRVVRRDRDETSPLFK
ncbi:hypothetical protein M514_07920 [Trichuris suis]|uniref:RNA-directed DNA polymerase n=1 Tax=Trichuris suis TaxID=68888 RepID=A0A085NJ02_9BILA|nr:hypothetical protein M514_07920 [Trichuris suis]